MESDQCPNKTKTLHFTYPQGPYSSIHTATKDQVNDYPLFKRAEPHRRQKTAGRKELLLLKTAGQENSYSQPALTAAIKTISPVKETGTGFCLSQYELQEDRNPRPCSGRNCNKYSVMLGAEIQHPKYLGKIERDF